MTKGMLLVISGPSGVGKGTICRHLLEDIPDLWLSVSATTRAPRPGEIEGIHYRFISDEKFMQMLEQDAFLESAGVYGRRYGTPRGPVEEKLEQGRDVILEIDPQGAMSVMAKMPEAVSIFVMPPSLEELRRRLVGRGTEAPEAIERRFGAARQELELMGNYTYAVVNDTVGKAASRIATIIQAERMRTMRLYRVIPE